MTYRDDAAGPLLARLYRPRGPGPFPGVVSVHGGAWTFNDRTSNAALDAAVARGGVVVMAVDFRMPPAAPYPASIEDINRATRWLKANAARLGADPRRIGGMGTSSGGHQIMLSALRPAHPAYAGSPPSGDASLAFVAVLYGVLDPLARYRMARERGMAPTLDAHHAYWPDEAAMEDGNPQRILERGEATPLPPVLLLQGTADANLTGDMASRFAAAYAARGGTATLESFEGEGHLFATAKPGSDAARRAAGAIIALARGAATVVGRGSGDGMPTGPGWPTPA